MNRMETKQLRDKKVVSPFEFAIMQAAGVDTSNVREETNEEKNERLRAKFSDFAKQIKVNDQPQKAS